MQFNEQQQEAINFHKGACAVIAGAGSGKSTVLVNRINNLINNHNIKQNEILAISFTRNTADDLKKKLEKMGHTEVNVGTFHSICARILAKEGTYYPPNKMIKDWEIEKAFNASNKKIDIEDIRSFISYQKNYLRGIDDTFVAKESNYTEVELREYYRIYEDFKKQNGLHDFDDYLIDCYHFLKSNPHKHTFDFVLVDENQDSNIVQNLIVKEVCPSKNVYVVGDYRQSIYGFRGSTPEQFMNFHIDWDGASVINLDVNYRSCKKIVHKANKFIEQYYGDYEHYSDSIPHRQGEGHVNIDTFEGNDSEAISVVDKISNLLDGFEQPKEIAVLYRLNNQSGNIEHELRKRNIDYDIENDGSFFKRKEVSGILAYLKLIIDPHDDGAFLEIFKLRNYPLAFFSEKLLNEMKRFAGERNLSLYEALRNMRYDNDWQQKSANSFVSHIENLRLQKDKKVDTGTLVSNIIKVFQMYEYINEKYSNPDDKRDRLDSLNILRSFIKSESPEKFLSYITNTKKTSKDSSIKLMSIHRSKGLEFKYVFLIGVEDGKFPFYRSDVVDEARLFYVGVTRAKDYLNISQISHNNKFIKEYL